MQQYNLVSSANSHRLDLTKSGNLHLNDEENWAQDAALRNTTDHCRGPDLLTQTLCLQPPKEFMIQPRTSPTTPYMAQVYESDTCEELYQKLSGDLDAEY